MMSAQPYPSAQYPMSMSPTAETHTRHNMYRGHPVSQATPPMGGHIAQFPGYPTPPTHGHSTMYRSPVPELTTFGLLTPQTAAPSQFGSPLMASGGYTPMPSTPSNRWGTIPALLSPMTSVHPQLPSPYGHHHHPSPIIGQDPTCAAPGEVFSSVPFRHDHMGRDALGFHHPVYPSHPGPVFRPGPGLGIKTGLHGQFILGADGQPATEIKKRSRTAQACERCRIRKARCFGGNPCNRCTKRRFQCEFSTAVRQRGPNKPQINPALNGSTGPGPTSAPAATSLATLANGRPSNDSSPGSTSGTGTGVVTPVSPTKRRHSLPEGPSQQYIPHAPAKSYSTTEVPRLDAVSEEHVNFTVVPHLPTPLSDYLSVPQPGSAGIRTDNGILYPTTPTLGTSTPGSGPASAGAERSPMFTYTPEMMDSSAPTTGGSSVDYPCTPISPATTFSPTLALTPTLNAHHAVNYFASQQDHNASSYV